MAPTSNLPVQLNSFVGRELEVSRVKSLVSTNHLVTLTGPGGVGKSRLALQLAREMLSSFKDGCWLVELAPLTDPLLVIQAAAQVLGVKELPGQPYQETLTNFCRSRQLLIILDNCEHLLDASAGLAQNLLENCPDLRLLVTSRETLNIEGEIVFTVTGLVAPDPRHLAALEMVSNYAAVKLFVNRAQLVQSDFTLSLKNVGAVVQICNHLDGLPIALELAAVRLRSITIDQLAVRLKENLRLLSQGSRTASPRQQSVYGLINWSYELLTSKEKRLFERLAVFSGDWSLEAAEIVCVGNELETNEILDLLSQLVNKSLVTMCAPPGMARYRFLEIIKQFALEKLTGTPQLQPVRLRFLNWAAKLGGEAGSQLWAGATQAYWFGTLEVEYTNLREAVQWGLEHEPVLAGRLSWDLTIFWETHGFLSEGRRFLLAVLVKKAQLPIDLVGSLFFAAGWLAHRQNDFDQAEELCARGLEIFEQEGNQERALNVLLNLGWISLCQGNLLQASERLEESLAASRRLENQYCVAASLSFLSLVALLENRVETAVELSEESVRLCQKLGSSHYLGWALTAQGAAALFLGEFEKARAIFLESLQQLQQFGERIVEPYILLGLAVVNLLEDNPERGVRLFGKAEKLWETSGSAIVPVFKQPYEMAVMYASIQLDESAIIKAWAEGREMRLEQLLKDPVHDHSLPLPSQEPVEILAPTRAVKVKAAPPASPDHNQKSDSQKNQKQELKGSNLAKDGSPSSATSLARLTGREVEVLRLLAAGKSNAEIGQALVLSTLTINTYLRTIYSKLEVSSRNAATRRAFEMGLV